MTFVTAPMKRISVPTYPARSSLLIRRTLVTAGLASALTAVALTLPGMASAQESLSHTILMESVSQPIAFPCPFGTHGGDGGSCRGGSLANDVRKHSYTITKDTGCALAGFATGAATANPAIGVASGVGCGVLLQDDPAH